MGQTQPRPVLPRVLKFTPLPKINTQIQDIRIHVIVIVIVLLRYCTFNTHNDNNLMLDYVQ